MRVMYVLFSDMAANKAVRWAEETEGNTAPSGKRAAPKKSAMRRNQSEDDILHSAATAEREEGSPSGSSDGEGSANRLRGYLEVKHNPVNGKGRSRLLRKVSGVEALGSSGPSATFFRLQFKSRLYVPGLVRPARHAECRETQYST